jgi:hypothetical protein
LKNTVKPFCREKILLSKREEDLRKKNKETRRENRRQREKGPPKLCPEKTTLPQAYSCFVLD